MESKATYDKITKNHKTLENHEKFIILLSSLHNLQEVFKINSFKRQGFEVYLIFKCNIELYDKSRLKNSN